MDAHPSGEAPAASDELEHAVGGPDQAADIDAQPLQDVLADVLPAEMLAFLLCPGANGADQPDPAFPLQRKHRGEVALVDRDVQLAVHQRAASVDVRDIEEVLVSAAWKADPKFLAHGGTRAIASGETFGLARRALQTRHDAAVHFLEVDQLGHSLDAHVQLFEPLDEEALVLVLRVDEPVGKGALARAEPAELDVRRSPASSPEVRRGEHQPRFDQLVGETELAVELQRSRLHCERPRSAAGSSGLVDDANLDPQTSKPESEHEAGGSCADDENLGVHAASLTEASTRSSRCGAGPFGPGRRPNVPRS